MSDPLTFAAAQAAVWQNKVSKGFDTTDLGEEFLLLVAEIGEAVDAWRKYRSPRPSWMRRILARLRIRALPPPVTQIQPIRLEVADALLFLLGIAEKTGFDAGAAVAEKLRINGARSYRRLPGGAHVKVQAG